MIITTFSFNYDGMDRINEYIKSVGGIQQEQWKFYYGPTGIDKVTRTQGGIQNLTIDYTTDTNGRILSAGYNETGGYSGELFAVYDNFGNMTDLVDSTGNSVRAVILDPNNASITQYNPQGIDDPFTYRAVKGFIGVEPWVGGGETVYLQGHIVIPNPWGDAVTNGTTTTNTEDIVTKEGGSSAGDPECIIEQCERMARVYGLNFKRGVLSGDYSGETLYSGQERNISDMSCEEIEHAMELASEDWDRLGALFDYDIGDLDDYCNIYDLIMKHQGKEHHMHTACQYWQLKGEHQKRC